MLTINSPSKVTLTSTVMCLLIPPMCKELHATGDGKTLDSSTEELSELSGTTSTLLPPSDATEALMVPTLPGHGHGATATSHA